MVHLILYVADQQKSKEFYKMILESEPILDVEGMTEFSLDYDCILGLMPETGIVKILGDKTPHPSAGNGIPRCELYIHVDKLRRKYNLLKKAGATEISKIQKREWGDKVCYFADPDGHIIAFAKKPKEEEEEEITGWDGEEIDIPLVFYMDLIRKCRGK